MKISSVLNILQLICQRSCAVMNDLIGVMRERRVSVALLQELCVSKERMCGLPSSWRAYVYGHVPTNAAVVVCEESVEAVCVNECTDEYGVCVWMDGDFGELFVVSMNCRYGNDIEPYLAYMERVCECVKGKRVIFGMDANAASPLWFSKDGGRSRENEMRGRILEEWVIANGMIVLNEPSESYTFSGMRGESDVDVPLMNGNMAGCLFKWRVMNDWCISDYNAILIQMMYDGMREMRVLNVSKRWMCKNVSWEEYESELGEIARTRVMSVFCETNVERMVERVTDWIQEVNEEYMKDRVRQSERKMCWWTRELSALKSQVQKCRRVWQRARKECRADVQERMVEYKRSLNEYKYRLRKVKEESWIEFVSKYSNLDPWGVVYRVCRGR